MTRFFRIVFLLSVGGLATVTHAGESFECRSSGRLLTDRELIDIAFAYEVAEYDLSEELAALGASGLLASDPNCCSVLREDNPFNEPRGWLSRLLSLPTILVILSWDLDPTRSSVATTIYSISLCGDVLDRRGNPNR